MAGCGTDIKLGGNPEAYEGVAQEVTDLGGLYVIGTERYKSRRVINTVARIYYLKQLDRAWIEHLEAMNDLHETIRLRTYAQKKGRD